MKSFNSQPSLRGSEEPGLVISASLFPEADGSVRSRFSALKVEIEIGSRVENSTRGSVLNSEEGDGKSEERGTCGRPLPCVHLRV
jgi:hypothetical protein